jgi:hypothetical protein
MTAFLRVLDAPPDEKASRLLGAVTALNHRNDAASLPGRLTFEHDPEALGAVPGSPFAYWLTDGLRATYQRYRPFEEGGRTVKQGLSTADDFRFVRVWWEPAQSTIASRWFPFAKGGGFSPLYADIAPLVAWERDGAEAKAWAGSLYGGSHWSRILKNTEFYRRPGLTWPLRGVRLSAQAVPANAIFSVAGKMAFADTDELLGLLGLFNSRPFDYLVNTRAGKVGGVQYEVGLIQTTPVPGDELAEQWRRLGMLARRGWSLKRSLDTSNETSHAFLLPPGLNTQVTGVETAAVERELQSVQHQIDEEAFGLYGIGPEDRAAIESTSRGDASTREGSIEIDADAADETEESVESPSTGALGSWLVGVAFRRFDPRLATGERAVSPEPEPFDPLPSRAPGMYPEAEEPTERPDILVDDEGHADDLAARAQSVADRVKVDAPENLRGWLAKEFFPLHIKMYSKSRRKAPIYWQLATPSAGYSVWVYIHAFSKDTLFRVQNDYIALKLAHEERRLESVANELRDGATAPQRKTLAAQESLVEELRGFLDEVKRVAPLWSPNLDDGVIINFAPLWRLAPQNKSWQKELKSTWDALCQGEYDWAHLAMHLWPERVVPKCAKDRSLAIAHGLEEVFWAEGADGKWSPRKTPTRSVEELVREQTSPSVKAALKSLLEAPAAPGSGGRGRAGRRRSAVADRGDA